jgi:hypothetical protein
MATIKKPAKKMQEGGNLKIKVKIKPDRKQAREDKDKGPLMKNPVRDAEWKKKEFEFDIAKEAAAKTKGMKKGGAIKKAKSGGSFPDLNKDGKITKADILKGRGVIAKKGKTIKKAQLGGLLDKVVGGLGKSAGGFAKIKDMFGNSGFGNAGLGMINSLRKKKQASAQAPAMKKGGKVVKKMQYGGAAASMVPPMMKKGGATKKCKYGCK